MRPDKISAEVVLLVEGPDDQTVVSLLPSALFDFKHPAFKPLVDFLKDLTRV